MEKPNIKLTSSELGALWSSYMAESSAVPMLTYFTQTVEDPEVKPIVEMALNKSTEHLTTLKEIFERENYPVPNGFSIADVNVRAPKLYSDIFVLNFLRNLGKSGIGGHGMAFSMAAREDIRKLYYRYLNEAADIEDQAKKIMLSKGVFTRPPYIAAPEQPDIVEKGSFLKGWFGDRRTLAAQEIAHIFMNFNNNAYVKALLISFSQTAQSEELRNYFVRGIEISRSLMESFRILLEESTLPAPITSDTEINDSTVAPISDKLMLFLVNQLNTIGISNLGGSLALSMKRDLVAKYLTMLKDTCQYAEDGINIMIKNGWFERPPQAINREHLTKEKNKYHKS